MNFKCVNCLKVKREEEFFTVNGILVEFAGIKYHNTCLNNMLDQDYNDLIEYLENIPCGTCDGEGFCDYGFGEDVKTMACEDCNEDGDQYDDSM